MDRVPNRGSDDVERQTAAAAHEPLLGRLARAWQSAYPDKAAGGPRALAGFHFQLEFGLLTYVRGWLEFETGDRDSQQTFVEELSDVVMEAANRPPVVQQAKLTQNSRTIRSGLNDLLTVHVVAMEVIPQRAEEVEYGLVFRSADPQAAQRVIDAWADEAPAVRRPFAARVVIGAHADPGGEIETLLSNRFHATEPERLRYEWVGELLHSLSLETPEVRRFGVEAGTKRIWRTLTDLKRSRNRRGGQVYLVSPADIPPRHLERGKVLTGQQPKFHHLRQGYFADRPKVLNRERERLEQWAGGRAGSSRETKVPVFWIAGRSGSGKSVLLIQLISKLRQERWDPIFCLDNYVEGLPEAVRWWNSSFDQEAPPLIAVDDPYGPGGRHEEVWREFLAELNSIRQAADLNRIPIVVCCGPTEQAKRLDTAFPGEIDLNLFELPQESPEELEDLRNWYRHRTDVEAPEAEPNLLLVQLFFQWQVGLDLKVFAQRFRSRIIDLDDDEVILPLLEQALSLNRLYLGFPEPAVDRRLPEVGTDQLRQLLQENHLSVGDEEHGRQGLWLAHPHLANGIYDAWFPPDEAPATRRCHFEDAARECMLSGESVVERLAPIEALALGVSAGDPDIQSRIDPGLLEALPGLYSGDGSPPAEQLPLGELALWIEVWTATGVTLAPDPVDIAMPMLTRQATRLREAARLCEALLRGAGRLDDARRRDLFEIVTDLLEEVPEWADWGRIGRVAIDVNPTDRLTRLSARWCQGHLRTEGAGWVVEGLLRGSGEAADVIRPAAVQLLRENPRHPGWGRVWTALWDVDPAAELWELGLSHLRAFPDDASWAYIFDNLAQGPSISDPLTKRTLRPLGEDWLGLHTQHLGWGVVWTVLWKDDPNGDTESRARRWLRQADPALPGFGYVWTALWSDGDRDKPLRELGLSALRRIGTSNLNWGQVFPALYRSWPGSDARALGLRWLGTAGANDPAWGHVLPAIWKVATEHRDSEMLVTLEGPAKRFLDEANPGHGGWGYVFDLLWKHRKTDELRNQALLHLFEAPSGHRGMAHLWELLWEEEENEERLLEWASAWLPEQFEHQGWPRVWTRICLEAAATEPHAELGERWLLAMPVGHDGWSYVFRALRPLRQSVTLRAKAYLWLSEGERHHMAWDIIWRSLWLDADAFGDRDELRDRGLRWLRSQQAHRQWPEVWVCLWADESSEELRQLGEQWLAGAGRGHNPKKSLVTRGLKQIAEPVGVELSWSMTAEALANQLRRGVTERLPEALAIVQAPPPSDEIANHDAWPKLWIEVWNRTQTYGLRKTALDWLDTVAPGDHKGRGYILDALWDSGRNRRLHQLGTAYLEDNLNGRTKWIKRWKKLWQFEPSTALRDLGDAWLAQNGSHQSVRDMRRCLSDLRLPPLDAER
jgi:hypothetical protein